jgi:hypothetical protein
MSIWKTFHQQVSRDIYVLSQYDPISTYDKIIEAIEIGLEDAHGILSNLGMQPKGDKKNSWWFKPWTEDHNFPTLQFVDELVDDTSLVHSNLFPKWFSVIVNCKQCKVIGDMS